MPIQIYVEVNGRPVQSYNIARVEKTVDDDVPTQYAVLRSGPNANHDASYRGPRYTDWNDGIMVEHRRDDGVEVLIHKAMSALVSSSDAVDDPTL